MTDGLTGDLDMPDFLPSQLQELGVRAGDSLLVHASYKSLGVSAPEEIIGALLNVLGPTGTLLLPALSYLQQPLDRHDTRTTPSCVGFLSEYFRTRAGSLRSLHPTHSVCAVGARAEAMLQDHWKDSTPCGSHSPFRRMIEDGGKILMLGCGLRPNTTMHAVEEYAPPPYLFGPEREYVITDRDGIVTHRRYRTHGFAGYSQRYDRIEALMREDQLRVGTVGNAHCHLLDAAALYECVTAKMRDDPFYFVERTE